MTGWRKLVHRREHHVVGALLCIALFLSVSYGRFGYDSNTFHFHQGGIKPADANVLHSRYVEFWKEIHGLILNNDPLCAKKPQADVPRGSVEYKADQDFERPGLVHLDTADLSRLKLAHSNFVKGIQSTTTARLVYSPNTRGVVFTASDLSLVTLTISISMLRKTGSNLPIEVFLDKPSQYTKNYCSSILSQLDAQCRFLSDIFITSGTAIEPRTYQYKIFAIVFSSFEDILYLDYDAWPLNQPDSLFDSSVFNITGMVLWPDFWFPSESPLFFEIAGINKIPHLNERASTESGIILYSKRKHNQSLLLAIYYNFYGPDYYYKLQSQGAPGEGDKETFGLAALALDEDFYAVRQGVKAIGRVDSKGEFVGIAMAQSDPVQDFLNTNTTIQQARQNVSTSTGLFQSKVQSTIVPKPLFVHANFPKVNPYTIFDQLDEHGLHKPVQDSNRTWVRGWTPRESALEMFGLDVEESFWRTIRSVTCETLRGVGLPTDTFDERGRFEIDQRDQRVCAMMDEYFQHVFEPNE